MTMKKIMFDDRYGLTQAVIEGRKIMTRRVVSDNLQNEWDDYDDFCTSVNAGNFPTTREYRNEKKFFLANARYKVGEIVAVAQNYEQIYHQEGLETMDMLMADMKASAGWRNKMFVKAYDMPHRIRITGINIEHLQDISDADCLREGIFAQEYFGNGEKHRLYGFDGFLNGADGWFARGWYDTPREAFASLIDKVSGRGTWERNPWVVAYEFELVK